MRNDVASSSSSSSCPWTIDLMLLEDIQWTHFTALLFIFQHLWCFYWSCLTLKTITCSQFRLKCKSCLLQFLREVNVGVSSIIIPYLSFYRTLCIAGKSRKRFRLHESPGQVLDNYWKLGDFDAGFWLLKSEWCTNGLTLVSATSVCFLVEFGHS
jgi:hypothetical protein